MFQKIGRSAHILVAFLIMLSWKSSPLLADDSSGSPETSASQSPPQNLAELPDPYVWPADDGGKPYYRVRLTETSLTETGSISGCDGKVQTRGYGLTLIDRSGIGISYTELSSTASGGTVFGEADVRIRHRYVDLSYTYGSTLLVTAGAGTLVKGDYSFEGRSGQDAGSSGSGKSLFIGPGFGVGPAEVYWIYRRNWVAFTSEDETRTFQSQHFQLGVGLRSH